MNKAAQWLLIAVGAIASLVGCNEGAGKDASASKATSAPPHNYTMRDGWDYAYPEAISHDAANSGQVAPKVWMFRFAGARDGRYQLHTTNGPMFMAVECTNPCQVLKLMSFIDKDYLRNNVMVEHLANQGASIASLAMQDAINGQMQAYGMERGKVAYQVWVDEKLGRIEFPVK